jgi:hypothetical protein
MYSADKGVVSSANHSHSEFSFHITISNLIQVNKKLKNTPQIYTIFHISIEKVSNWRKIKQKIDDNFVLLGRFFCEKSLFRVFFEPFRKNIFKNVTLVSIWCLGSKQI